MKFEFTVTVDINPTALRERNDTARESMGVVLPDDPMDWGDSDLTLAITDDIASIEITSSEPA